MSIEDIKPGDLIVVEQRRFAQPQIGIITPVYGKMVLYEFTTDPRPTCVRTGRTEPKGIQAHFLNDFLDGAAKVLCYPLVRGLYVDEESRLLAEAEICLGRGAEAWGGDKCGGVPKIAATFIAHLWRSVGVMRSGRSVWTPTALIAYAQTKGIVGKPLILN